MAKGGGGKVVTNLLRISGILYATVGGWHLIRYFTKDQLDVVRFHLTYFGSLLLGLAMLLLSFACFRSTGK